MGTGSPDCRAPCVQPRAMVVARLLVEELLVRQRQDGAVIVGLEVDRDLRFALGRALPGPREDQLAVGHDLAIDAAHAVMLAIGRPELHAEAAADPEIGLGDGGVGMAGDAPPADHFFRLRPGLVELRRRRFEAPLEGEAGLAGHESSSKKSGEAVELLGPVAFVAGEPVHRLLHGRGLELAGDGPAGLGALDQARVRAARRDAS